jgi:hypothetical protein
MGIAELANDIGEPGVKLCAGHAETRQALFFEPGARIALREGDQAGRALADDRPYIKT